MTGGMLPCGGDAELGICQQRDMQATPSAPSLWDPSAAGEPVARMRKRHQQAKLLCAQCPLLEACERMLSACEWRGVRVAGVVAGRYSDRPQPLTSSDPYQLCCRWCGGPMDPQALVAAHARKRCCHTPYQYKQRHMGEGLCNRCYQGHSRAARAARKAQPVRRARRRRASARKPAA